ncbi:MAG: D-alanyl-D-alanine carboxypeptidase/D-alanyl-D-alanine-endopeptidase [Chitinophagaceae bacterium]|nr:D-alanyl-D-alanine carboxypeptidase/D-alanyl-D-alanine-endopeptidase [Chitinophagaceae bacterium]
MKSFFYFIPIAFLTLCVKGQGIQQKLSAAYKKFESDSQLKHGISSLYVVESKTGKAVFEKNAQIGLAPASTQKVITSATAFELLGKRYRYKTEFGYKGTVTKDSFLVGFLSVNGSGDPTPGSWRYSTTREDGIFFKLIESLKINSIFYYGNDIDWDNGFFDRQPLPDGWIWQDIGNYYGAGHWSINWRENQINLILKSGNRIGDSVKIIETQPHTELGEAVNNMVSAEKGSGDNAYYYFSLGSYPQYIKGSIPILKDSFSISIATPNAPLFFQEHFKEYASKYGVKKLITVMDNFNGWLDTLLKSKMKIIYTHYSPPLDSMNYWFLKKSINLYGEAFIKTMAFEKTGFGSTEKGAEIVKDFWKQKGIDKAAINIVDGSGLSPLNRVTTDALVKVMQIARARPWFNSFYDALPETNSIKMKSGSISGVRSYTGYIKNKQGIEYTFAFIVNNYNGSASSAVKKMWQVLDVLK